MHRVRMHGVGMDGVGRDRVDRDQRTDSADPAGRGLGAELRDSVLLLGLSAAVTAAVALAASTAVHVLG